MPTVSDQAMNDDDEPDERLVAKDIGTPESELLSKQVAMAVNQAVEALPEELAAGHHPARDRRYELRGNRRNHGLSHRHRAFPDFRAREAIAVKLRPILDTPEDRRW
jgi:RNA polymerase sigma-70 factor (ECF subfamily)